MAEEYSDASLLLPGSDPLLRTEPVNGGLAGARAGSTLGGLTSPTLARFLLPKRRSIRPRCLRPRPTGGWLSSSAGQRRLRACTLLRRSAFLKLTSRCALTKLAVRNGKARARPETSCSRSRSRAMAIAARRTTTSPVETQAVTHCRTGGPRPFGRRPAFRIRRIVSGNCMRPVMSSSGSRLRLRVNVGCKHHGRTLSRHTRNVRCEDLARLVKTLHVL